MKFKLLFKNLFKKFGEIFYKRKYVGNECITRVLCFRFRRKNKFALLENKLSQISTELNSIKSSMYPEKEILYNNGNKIIIYDENGEVINNPQKIDGLKITFGGSDNLIEIYKPCNFINGSHIEIFGDSCHCTLKKCQLSEVHLVMQHSAKCSIDEGATVCGYIHLACEKDLSLKIGKGCMFSGGAAIWATDGHIIRDASTNEIINRIKNGIEIGDHCWIGNKVTIIKNTILADNTIVGAKSLVSGHFTEPNTIIAGNPAKVIKKNVIWDRAPLD